MRRAISALAVYFVFWGNPIVAQTTNWKSYTATDGLVHSYVTAFHQDRKGYLWIGTMTGMSRFDGESFENYDLEDSIASNHIISIFEEDNGMLWFLTTAGLKRYDGKRFSGFTTENGLPDNLVTAIYKDRYGNIWMGTKKGISLLDGNRTQTFTEKDGVSEKEVKAIYQDRTGKIWILFRFGGISRFALADENPEWRTFTTKEGLPHHIVNDVGEDHEGNLWVATPNGVAKFVEGKFLPAPFNELLPSRMINSIHLDADGALWFRTALDGMLKWDGHERRQFTTKDGLASNLVNTVLKDRTGRLWFATDNGVSKYEKNGFQTFRTHDGLASDVVRAVFEDREGNLWFGTLQGISKYEPERFSTFLEDAPQLFVPQNSQVQKIFKDRQGNLWFPSFRGLGYYNNSEFKIFTLKDGLPDTAIHAVLQDPSGNFWVGTPKGISIFDGQKFHQITDSLIAGKPVAQMLQDKRGKIWIVRNDNVVIVYDGTKFFPFAKGELSKRTIENMSEDSNGHIWFRTLVGMACYDGKQTQYFPAHEIMPASWLENYLADRQGNMWIGTTKGLAKYDGKSFSRFTKDEGLPEGHVHGIYQDSSGVLWLALERSGARKAAEWAAGGITRYDGKSFRLLTAQDGLLSNRAYGFFEEKSGMLWFFTDKGASRYDGKGFTNLSIATGLAGNRVSVMIRDENKNLWIGTDGGLSKYNGQFVSSFAVQDGLLDNAILDLKIDRQNHLWIRTRKGVQQYIENKIAPPVDLVGLSIGAKAHPLDRKLTLAHNQNNLLFRYRGVSFAGGSEKLQYVYRLEGHDETWFGPVKEKAALYHNLGPGSYKFVVKALSRDLYESEIPAEFSFAILPPFWKTWWFLILSSLSTLLLGYIGYRRRVNAKLEKARILNELKAARDMQMGLMPKCDPAVPGFDISGICKPAEEVGGDYFDYVWLDEEKTKFGIAIVDVSGKAMKGAMTAVMTSGMIYSEIGNSHSPREILQKINKPMYLKTDRQIFTAMSFAVIDTESKLLTFSSAGQTKPILKHNGEIQYIEVEGMHLPLGIREEVHYGEATIQLQPGDMVMFYTDGVPEAMNETGELFDFERLETTIRDLPSTIRTAEVVERLLSEVRRFSGKARQHDDMTMVVLHVL
ncbi:SpoIIE family protein phosphatase [candidate division KSB1 bacterium]|nr:SpoIIE family protein phosphatase [candidate division KSB1 bacterium]